MHVARSGSERPFQVRKATSADEQMIADAWRRAYGAMASFKYPDRWRWNILANPYVEDSQRPLVWVATDGERVAAWTSAFVVPLEVNGKTVLGAHSVDTFTLPEFRRHGFGEQLQEQNQRAHAIFIAIDPSAGNRRNKYRIGGWPGRPLTTYLKLLGGMDGARLYDSALDAVVKHLGAAAAGWSGRVRRWGPEAMLRWAVSGALHARQRIVGRTRACVARAGLTVREVDRFDAESDELWGRVAPLYALAVRRDAQYLNWKYADHPHQRYQRFLAYDGRRPVGTLIYRFPIEPPEQRAGIVSECFCVGDDPSMYATLYARAEAGLASRGLPMIRAGASTAGQHLALASLGYQQVDIDVPVVQTRPGETGLEREALLAGEWLLSLGDSDLDQIREVHQPSFVECVRMLSGTIPGMENLPRA